MLSESFQKAFGEPAFGELAFGEPDLGELAFGELLESFQGAFREPAFGELSESFWRACFWRTFRELLESLLSNSLFSESLLSESLLSESFWKAFGEHWESLVLRAFRVLSVSLLLGGLAFRESVFGELYESLISYGLFSNYRYGEFEVHQHFMAPCL